MEELYIPVEVWNCVARYYENPVLLLQLAEVCRNSYHGATMDSAWETLIPYECEGSLYRAFIEAALATTKKNRYIIRCCWTGFFPPEECLPTIAFKRKDFDTAFALATQNGHLYSRPLGDYPSRLDGGYSHLRSYLFDRCVQSRKFIITALNISSWLYDNYNRPQAGIDRRHVTLNPEYCEIAMRRSVNAWWVARTERFPVRENYDLRKRMLTSKPRVFTIVFSQKDLCRDPEFILGSAPYHLDSAECFVECCHPNVFDLELCEKLCGIGFPIWIAKPNIDARFLKRFDQFTDLPPKFENDREIFKLVAKNNCKILKTAIPEFRKDIPLVMAIFEHNPGVLRYCDPSILTDAEFMGCFKESLTKPNHFFFRTKPSHTHTGLEAFPEVLQTQELALIAVESYGQWIHYFPRFWRDFEVMKAAVVTWPLAYSYAPTMKCIKYKWSESICKINPRAVWVAEQKSRFIRKNRSIVQKAIQLGPLPNRHNCFPYLRCPPRHESMHMLCVLPEILRAHPSNYEALCWDSLSRYLILRSKNLVIAALEGTRNGSILWDVPPRILDEDIWKKAREVRQRKS